MKNRTLVEQWLSRADLHEEAIHCIDELMKRSKRSPTTPFRCAAEGTLAEPGKRYSSVELQHKAREWREA